MRYEDIDKSCLIELRGTKASGEIGMQTMVPPSVWTKDGQREPLSFLREGDPQHLPVSELQRAVVLTAITMLLSKHLGKNGFGHECRLAWAGYLLRAGLSVEELVKMGEVISEYTNNTETQDVRLVIQSTASKLNDSKIKGAGTLIGLIGDKGKAVISRINEWLGKDTDFITNQKGSIVADNQANIRKALQFLQVSVSYDIYSEKIMVSEAGKKERVLNDSLSNGLWLQIDREFHFRPTKQFFEIVFEDIAHEKEFHPVRDYLATLRWDKVPRIEKWLSVYGGAEDNEYTRAVSSIVLIAAVKRVRTPGCKYDEMLVLESEQGLNKSSALRALCPSDDWFSDDLPLNVDAKQIIERTLGKWIIEASDLVGGRKADRDHLKSMLSRQSDGPVRLAFAHIPIQRERQFIIIGTTNNSTYLSDSTGARRFWPVGVKKFDVDGICRDRDQLWAEASEREANGASARLPEHLWSYAGQEQDARREVDSWEELIMDRVATLTPNNHGKKQITTAEIFMLLGIEVARQDRLATMRISDIMQRLGFHRTKVYADKKTQAGYQSRMNDLPLEPIEI
jgi:hypothetical protein